jgi:hypothetical protein
MIARNPLFGESLHHAACRRLGYPRPQAGVWAAPVVMSHPLRENSPQVSLIQRNKEPHLNLDSILAELKAERNRLSRAIDALEGTAASASDDVAASIKKGGRRVQQMSAAARQRMSAKKK